MKSLFRFFVLLNAIIVPALSVCSDRPAIPTISPKLITSASPGISNFPSSTKQLSVTMIITPGVTCSTGAVFPLFALSVQPSGGGPEKYLIIYIDCDSRNIEFRSDWFSAFSVTNALSPTVASSIGLFVTIDLNTGMKAEVQTNFFKRSDDIAFTAAGSFDANSKFYLCAGQNGALAKACTVQEFVLEYQYYGENTWTYAHLAGTNPSLAALYPLTAGSLASVIGSTSSAYFGDSATSPSTGTSPTWDSSNSFVTITSGQFVSVPLPSLSSSLPTVSYSFSFAAWVKITNIPTITTTIFSMHSATGIQVGYKLIVTQSTKAVSLAFGSTPLDSTDPPPVVTLGTWQLIGFAVHLTNNQENADATIFVGSSWLQQYKRSTLMDLSTASVMRIGGASNSFEGYVSLVRITTPGGGIIRTTNLCSSKNSIELGTESFPLTCSVNHHLSPTDNTCYSSSCSSGTYLAATFTSTPLCVSCPKTHCDTCDNENCLTCESNYFLNEGDCINPCPDGKYSDGATCQKCPTPCSKCTSSVTCQACSTGYTLSGSFCILSPSASPSSSKTEASAAQTVGASVSAVGSIVSVGSSVMPIAGLVSEVVQNTRYLNLSVTDELAQIYQTFSTDMISWELPNFMENLDDYNELPNLFARYSLDSSFLVNFWSTMMTVGVSLCVLVFCLGIQKWCLEGRTSRGFFGSLVQKILAGSINFIVVQAYGCLDNILFYFVLDIRTNSFDTAFSKASFAIGIIFMICGVSLMIYSILIVHKYHVLKREGLAKNNMKNLEAHHKKNKYLEVFYGDFSDADVWSQCFLAYLVLRSNFSSLALTLLFDYPLMQTVFLIILDGAIIIFMIIAKPFTTLRGVFFQYYFETIVLIVHICCFILSWNDEPSETLKKRVCTAIIYLNTALVTGGLCFMSIDIHETVRDKINEWKLRKAEGKNSAISPGESGISLQNDSTIIEKKTPRAKQLRINDNMRNYPGRNHLKSVQLQNSRRRPRIEVTNNKDFEKT